MTISHDPQDVALAPLSNLRFRWINCQNFEIVLPNGKHILTDPYVKDPLPGHCPSQVTEFQAKDYEGADYIIVQHNHFDHDLSCGDVYRNFGGKFLVHEAAAYEFGKCFDIPYIHIIPYATQGKYELEDFTLETFKGYHSVNKWISGEPSKTEDGGVLHFGFQGHQVLEPLGSMFNVGYVLTTPENYRIAFVAGSELRDAERSLSKLRPNLLIRQFGVAPLETDISFFQRVGAQVILPTHHEGLLFAHKDVRGMANQINEALAARGCHGRVFYPERYQWYTISTGIRNG